MDQRTWTFNCGRSFCEYLLPAFQEARKYAVAPIQVSYAEREFRPPDGRVYEHEVMFVSFDGRDYWVGLFAVCLIQEYYDPDQIEDLWLRRSLSSPPRWVVEVMAQQKQRAVETVNNWLYSGEGVDFL